MKAELHVQIVCPKCSNGTVLQNPLQGEHRIARCGICGFKCQLPTVDVVPCDGEGNELPDGFATESDVEQAKWVAEQELG